VDLTVAAVVVEQAVLAQILLVLVQLVELVWSQALQELPHIMLVVVEEEDQVRSQADLVVEEVAEFQLQVERQILVVVAVATMGQLIMEALVALVL
jgi:hypothetical protein